MYSSLRCWSLPLYGMNLKGVRWQMKIFIPFLVYFYSYHTARQLFFFRLPSHAKGIHSFVPKHRIHPEICGSGWKQRTLPVGGKSQLWLVIFIQWRLQFRGSNHRVSSFIKIGQPRPLFVYFQSFSNTTFTEISVGVSGIRTWIVRVEGKHAADHLTTTTDLGYHLNVLV